MLEQLLQSRYQKPPVEQQRYGKLQPSLFIIPAVVALTTSLTVNLCMLVSRKLFQCLSQKKPVRPECERERVNPEPFPRSPLAGGSGRG